MNVGSHVVCDLYGVAESLLLDVDTLHSMFLEKVAASGATILSHKFEPQGGGVVLIAESHFSWHTWPEYGFIAIDYFTCGDAINAKQTVDAVVDCLHPQYVQIKQLDRGEQVGMTGPTLLCLDGT